MTKQECSEYSNKQEKRCIEQWLCCRFAQKYETRVNPMFDRCDSVIIDKNNGNCYGMEFKDKSEAKDKYRFFSTYINENKQVYISDDKIDYLSKNYETSFVTVFFRDKVAVVNVRDVLKCKYRFDWVNNPNKGLVYEKHFLIPASLFKTVNNEWFNEEYEN